MAGARSAQEPSLRERSLPLVGEGEERLWKWVLVSTALHIVLVASFFLVPYLPLRSAPVYPVYSVDLVGGEKIGGTTLGTELTPPRAKEKPKTAPSAPPPVIQEVKKEVKKEIKAIKETKEIKKEKKKLAEKPPDKPDKTVKSEEVREKVALKEPVKKEPVKKEAQKEPAKKEVPKAAPEEAKAEAMAKTEEGLPDGVRDKLIQAALERVRTRAESAQKKQKEEVMSSGPGEGEGAAALGPGGRGGGIVKGIEFLVYRNRMLQLIRERWAWVGKRGDLEVTVQFGVQENGEIAGLRIMRASGDPSFDESVIRAVKKASPLPPPPENYRKDFMDVELIFRPKDLGG